MPTPNCEELSNSASAKPSYFFLLFDLIIFMFNFSSCLLNKTEDADD